MIKPDLIITQPTDIDYPYSRHHIRKNRDLYNNVFIGFSEHNIQRKKYIQFTKQVFAEDNVTIFDPITYFGSQDWRHVSVSNCLKHSTSSHVLFLEQDLIIKNENLLYEIFSSRHPVVGFIEGSGDKCDKTSRLHPGFFFISREILDKTTCDFSANPPQWDHFGSIRNGLKNEEVTVLEDLGFSSPNDWEHISGLTHNYALLVRGQLEAIQHKRQSFIDYNKLCLSLDIEQDPEFILLIQQAAALGE